MNTPSSNDILCALASSSPVCEATPVEVPVKTDRKVYKRRGVVHVCAKGLHFSPGIEATTFVDITRSVDFTLLGLVAGVETIEVRQSSDDGDVREFWFPVTVPRKARTSKDEVVEAAQA